MSRYTRKGMRRERIMRNLDTVTGGTLDERFAEALRMLRANPQTTIYWQAQTDAETLEVGELFRLLGYRTKVSTDAEPAAAMIVDVLGAIRGGRPYRVRVWTDGGDAAKRAA